MKVFWNVNSRVFTIRRFFNLNNGRWWWLINLRWFTIVTGGYDG